MKTNLQLRHFALFASLVLLPAALLQAATVDKHQMDEQAITQLEQRAQQANPREQCFLYTELVAAMTDLAGRQMVDGDTDHASAMLKKIEHYAQLIHIGISNDPKRVKNAEMLIVQERIKVTIASLVTPCACGRGFPLTRNRISH